MLDDAQVAVVLTTPEHEAALAPLARQAGGDLRLLQPQACAPLSPHSLVPRIAMTSSCFCGCAREGAQLTYGMLCVPASLWLPTACRMCTSACICVSHHVLIPSSATP